MGGKIDFYNKPSAVLRICKYFIYSLILQTNNFGHLNENIMEDIPPSFVYNTLLMRYPFQL